MSNNTIIIGAGAHAEVIIDIIESENKLNIIGIIDSIRDVGSMFLDKYKIIGRQSQIKELQLQYNFTHCVIAIGDNYLRKQLVTEITEKIPDLNYPNIIHYSVTISKKSRLGKGNVIMPGVIINTKAKLGDYCIINTNSSLEHYCIMDNYSSLSAGVTTGGFIHFHEGCAVTLGVTLFDRINIGRYCVIGSGSLVTKDTEEYSLYYGVPAKLIRKRKANERYLK